MAPLPAFSWLTHPQPHVLLRTPVHEPPFKPVRELMLPLPSGPLHVLFPRPRMFVPYALHPVQISVATSQRSPL